MIKYVSFIVTGRHTDISFKPENVPCIKKIEDWGALYLIDIKDVTKINIAKLTDFVYDTIEYLSEYYPDDTYIVLELFDENYIRQKNYEGYSEDYFCLELNKNMIDVFIDVIKMENIYIINKAFEKF